MSGDDKNPVLALYFEEGRSSRRKAALHHLGDCEDCREYLETLERTGRFLERWADERPAPDMFDRIAAALPAQPRHRPKAAAANPLPPLAAIAAAIAAIIAVLLKVQDLVAGFPWWNSLGQAWPFRSIGPLGFCVLAFFALGAFATLSLAPFLYFHSRSNG